MNQENLKFIHNTIIHWIDKTDIKANIFLGFVLAVLGYVLKDLNLTNNIYSIKFLLFLIFIISVSLSLFYILKTLWPKLSNNDSNSFIYFKHISDRYIKNEQQAIFDFRNLQDDAIEKDVVNQIISLSFIATSKYKDLQKAIIFLILEVVLAVLLLIINT